jgi:hypothetical protein
MQTPNSLSTKGKLETPGFFVVVAGLQIISQIKIMIRPIEED